MISEINERGSEADGLPVCRLEDERKARRDLERDVGDLRRSGRDTKLSGRQTLEEIHLVKEELGRLKRDHEDVSGKERRR